MIVVILVGLAKEQELTQMARVYIAGPYSNGDVALNVRRALEAAHLIYNAGHIPYVPHLTHFWHMMFPRPYEEWLHLDNQWVPLCHILLRLQGESSGADKEVTFARTLQMPVVYESAHTGLAGAIESITQYGGGG